MPVALLMRRLRAVMPRARFQLNVSPGPNFTRPTVVRAGAGSDLAGDAVVVAVER